MRGDRWRPRRTPSEEFKRDVVDREPSPGRPVAEVAAQQELRIPVNANENLGSLPPGTHARQFEAARDRQARYRLGVAGAIERRRRGRNTRPHRPRLGPGAQR